MSGMSYHGHDITVVATDNACCLTSHNQNTISFFPRLTYYLNRFALAASDHVHPGILVITDACDLFEKYHVSPDSKMVWILYHGAKATA